MGRHTIDLSGQQFGRLTVKRRTKQNAPSGNARWLCVCTCGSRVAVPSYRLQSGVTKSCGCLMREGPIPTHDKSRTPTYRVWRDMLQRCTNEKNESWNNYGGRGIKVCRRWFTFENFLADMGERPDGKELDRRDNDKGYIKSNCRWITKKQQSRNRRTNHLISFQGRTKTLVEWAETQSLHPTTLGTRLNNGWNVKRALLTPVRNRS